MKKRYTFLFGEKGRDIILSLFWSLLFITLGAMPNADIGQTHYDECESFYKNGANHLQFHATALAGYNSVIELSENVEEDSSDESMTSSFAQLSLEHLVSPANYSSEELLRVSSLKIYILYQSLRLYC
jgi:hypothetical protein